MMTFLQAVARQEGYYAPNSRPHRDNDPGDIEFKPGGFAARHGATKGDGRFAIFPTEADGFAADRDLFSEPAVFSGTGPTRKLVSGYLGATISEILNRYAPPVENQTNIYIAHVCEWTGLTPDTVLTAALLG